MTESTRQREWYGVDELAEYLGLDGGGKAIHWLVYRGTAPRHYKIANKLRFRHSDVTEWLERQAVEPSAQAS